MQTKSIKNQLKYKKSQLKTLNKKMYTEES